MYMSSQCTNDGTYTLTVTFKPGVDLNMAQVLVQNRESLAEPILPDLVKRRGVTVKKKSPSILMIVNLFSPDGSRGQPLPEQLRDDPACATSWPGSTASATSPTSASATTACGSGSIPQKMAFRNLTASDVVSAIEQQNIQVAAGQIGQPPVPTGQVVPVHDHHAGPAGRCRAVRRHDPQDRRRRAASSGCATWPRVELGAQGYDQACTLDGKPSVALSVYQRPGSNALRDRRARQATRWRSSSSASPRGSTTRSSTTPRRSSPSRSTRCSRRLRDAVILVAIVVLLVPAELAVGAHSAGRRAGGHRRHLRGHGRDGLQPQQPDALRAGAGDRHRGRRRDRGGRGGRAPHRGTGWRRARRRSRRWTRSPAPVIAVGLVLTAVFVPCAFITGITGQFFRQFALTIATSTVISAFNSLTLSPALAALLLAAAAEGRASRRCRGSAFAGRRLAGPAIASWALSCARWRPAAACTLRLASLDARPCWRQPIAAVAVGGGWSAGWSSRPLNRAAGLDRSSQFNPGFDAATGGLRPDGRRAAAGQRAGAGGLRRAARADLLGLHAHAHRASSRRRTRATCWSTSSCPTRRRWSGPRR